MISKNNSLVARPANTAVACKNEGGKDADCSKTLFFPNHSIAERLTLCGAKDAPYEKNG